MTTTARRSALAFLDPAAQPTTLAVLLYGPPGTGKSTAAASMPGPVLYLNAESPRALREVRARHEPGHIREFPITGKQSLIDAALYLRDGGDGEKTVVLDPVEDVWRILIEEAAPAGRATLQQFGDAGTQIERFCRFLVKDSGLNVVLVCHENPMDTGDGVVLMPMTGGRKNPQVLAAMCDVVGYTAVIQSKDAPPRYVAQTIPNERRYAKCRGGILPPVADLDLSEWLRLFSKTPQKEK